MICSLMTYRPIPIIGVELIKMNHNIVFNLKNLTISTFFKTSVFNKLEESGPETFYFNGLSDSVANFPFRVLRE